MNGHHHGSRRGRSDGEFTYTTPFSSKNVHGDPLVQLASHCILETFGPTVQLVADAIQQRGCCTPLPELIDVIQAKVPPPRSPSTIPGLPSRFFPCQPDGSGGAAAMLLVMSGGRRGETVGGSNHARNRGGGSGGSSRYCTDVSSIRASLIVLIQHSIVTVHVAKHRGGRGRRRRGGRRSNNDDIEYEYRYHPDKARLLARYYKYVTYIKKAMGGGEDEKTKDVAGYLVETLLLMGRLRTVDVVVETCLQNHDDLQKLLSTQQQPNQTTREITLEAFYKLVEGGYIEKVQPIPTKAEDDDGDDDGEGADEGEYEAQFDSDNEMKPSAQKRVKMDSGHGGQEDDRAVAGHDNSAVFEDAEVVELLRGHPAYLTTLPRDTVWRVNISMFHDMLRAGTLGEFAKERCGRHIDFASSVITAALRYRAYQEHVVAVRMQEHDFSTFRPSDIIPFLPTAVHKALDEKPGGEAPEHLARIYEELASMGQKPEPVRHVPGAAGAQQQYTIDVDELLLYQRQRLAHQIICDRHGESAGRMFSILIRKGYLESDTLADLAMEPVKETREILYRLYQSHYIDLLQLSTAVGGASSLQRGGGGGGQQYHASSGNVVFLWNTPWKRVHQQIVKNVATALWNIRLRRQHQVEHIGKVWVERERVQRQKEQQAASAGDDGDDESHLSKRENIDESDRLASERFHKGIERLENAALQLEETLMVLQDY